MNHKRNAIVLLVLVPIFYALAAFTQAFGEYMDKYSEMFVNEPLATFFHNISGWVVGAGFGFLLLTLISAILCAVSTTSYLEKMDRQ